MNARRLTETLVRHDTDRLSDDLAQGTLGSCCTAIGNLAPGPEGVMCGRGADTFGASVIPQDTGRTFAPAKSSASCQVQTSRGRGVGRRKWWMYRSPNSPKRRTNWPRN